MSAQDSPALEISAPEPERCWYCGTELGRDLRAPNGRTKDHQIPKSRGGRFLVGNRVLACLACNQRKANRTVEEYRTWWAERLGHHTITFYGEMES